MESRDHMPRRRLRPMFAVALLLALTGGLGAALAGGAAGAQAPGERPAPEPLAGEAATPTVADLAELEERLERAEALWESLGDDYLREVAPIQRVLLRYRDDPRLTRRIAVALVREARASGLEPRLLLAVLLVENPWLNPSARSPVGAVGLMQVMPLHAGHWRDCAPDLEDIEANICHGARIFAHYFRSERGDVERALLRYNGCVRGTNTPDCHQYPYHVFARAGRASVLAWLDSYYDGPASERSRSGAAAAP